jgi:hypothetical protein
MTSMKSKSLFVCLAAGLLAGVFVAPAPAQNAATEAQKKVLAKRAAEADAYRKLAETVYGLQITSDTYVRDFVTESDEIRSAVDSFIKGVRLGQPRWYEDGACEVDAEVTVAKIIQTLEEAHDTYYKGKTVVKVDFQRITETVKKDVISVTGSGAPRPELPPNLPVGTEQYIEPLPAGYAPTVLSVPGIWKTIPAQARLMAKQAAIRDAQRKLLEQVKGLRLTSETLVRDFVTESDEIRTHASGLVVGATEVGQPYYYDNELICEVTMEVPIEKVITTIKELHSAHYKGNTVNRTDIENIEKTVKRAVIRATGMGVPPARFVSAAPAGGTAAGPSTPPWFMQEIRVIGEGTDPQFESAQGRLKARRAAELDAMRKLAEQIHGLQISSTTTVQDFVTQSDEIRSQVNAVIAGAVIGDPEFVDGVARVPVSIGGAEVWQVINSQLTIESRRGNG